MTDNEFTERFNRYTTNLGLVLVDLSNIEQYAEKYNITIDEHYRHSSTIRDGFAFFIKSRNDFAAFYPSIDTMIKGNDEFWSIFKLAEQEYNIISTDVYCFNNVYENELLKSLLNIKGNSKEEISLKLQLMGY